MSKNKDRFCVKCGGLLGADEYEVCSSCCTDNIITGAARKSIVRAQNDSASSVANDGKG